MKYSILCFSLLLCGMLSAQVTFVEEPELRKIMDQYEERGKQDDLIDGWRIKLISTTNRRKLENAKYLFEREYSHVSGSTDYENPYYSLKVGAFETRYDLEPLLVLFKNDFREAIPFRDKIYKSELFKTE